MPIKKRKEGDFPDGCFIAVHAGNNEWLPLEPGTELRLVENPNSPNRVFPMVLKKVAHDALTFTLGDTDYIYKLTTAKPHSREALLRMQRNRGESRAGNKESNNE